MPPEITASLVLFVLLIVFLAPNIKIIKVDEAAVVERLGAFIKIIDQPGIHFLIPLVDRIVQKESLLPTSRNLTFKENGYDEKYQYTYQIKDIKMFCYAATEPLRVMEEQMVAFLKDFNNQIDQLNEITLNFGVAVLQINKINQ